MNKSEFVQLMLVTARQYPDPKDSIAFLDKIASKVVDEKEAYVLALMEAAHYKLVLNDAEGTKNAIEECETILDSLSGVEPVIHAGFYRVCADFYKAKGDYGLYYKNALLFLACVELENISPQEKLERAHDLAISALLGESLYNFGELLLHPILDTLNGTPNEWLRNLLFAFNAGDMGKFDVLSTNFAKQPLLAQQVGFLRQKLCIMSLMELIFNRTGDHRRIGFDIIAKETRLPQEEVEHLVMKALSLGIIKGTIDQVDQVVHVDWVQPRVLDKTQVEFVRKQVATWRQKVNQLANEVRNEHPELLVR